MLALRGIPQNLDGRVFGCTRNAPHIQGSGRHGASLEFRLGGFQKGTYRASPSGDASTRILCFRVSVCVPWVCEAPTLWASLLQGFRGELSSACPLSAGYKQGSRGLGFRV